MITGIALICRAAIEGGLNEETAFTLSDFYIQKLEDQNNLIDILSLMEEAIYDYTSRVAQASTRKFSAPITTCVHFIENQLYGDITLDQLSAICHLSPNYLSSLFKKEVGISFTEYIQLVISRFLITHCVADASIVGFLTEFPEAPTLTEDTWLEVVGTIGQTTYEGASLPVIHIDN